MSFYVSAVILLLILFTVYVMYMLYMLFYIIYYLYIYISDILIYNTIIDLIYYYDFGIVMFTMFVMLYDVLLKFYHNTYTLRFEAVY